MVAVAACARRVRVCEVPSEFYYLRTILSYMPEALLPPVYVYDLCEPHADRIRRL